MCTYAVGNNDNLRAGELEAWKSLEWSERSKSTCCRNGYRTIETTE
ncbi:hypothetical protein BCUN_1732 [Bifidobacterium cuniculi]|uniref:Uncharacterized protein n=1 Tax=Bifidobacterium cuniculi TaxID=1688 RepID=A0A087ADS7_9BIFI|nr:hypothetical protein BCUN_2232 [Bifidobacterium cuniculi]KFI62020.1 hypothetical protein BCUN_1732 [Bifidobacterium cuniculi]